VSLCLGQQIKFVVLLHRLNVKVVVAAHAEEIN
jgi:hypothetical protein